MKEFILLALKARTSPDFSRDDLKHAGKLDVVCSTIANTLWVSNGIREDTRLHVVMNGPKYPPKIIRFEGDKIVDFAFDEKGIATIIKRAVEKGKDLSMGEESEVQRGIYIRKESFESLVKDKALQKPIFYLNKKGEDIQKTNIPQDFVFIFGDLRGIPKNTERLLKNLNTTKIRLSPLMLFASHCPILVHNEIDRKAFGWE